MAVIYLLMLVIHFVSTLLSVQAILIERSLYYVAKILLKVFMVVCCIKGCKFYFLKIRALQRLVCY